MLLCYATDIPERCSSASLLLLLPAASLCCSSAAAVLHKCNWCGYVITGYVITALLHLACAASQAAPQAAPLAWVEEFKLSLSLELA